VGKKKFFVFRKYQGLNMGMEPAAVGPTAADQPAKKNKIQQESWRLKVTLRREIKIIT
jgi:hypothetical protein